MKAQVVIVGAGGHAKVIVDILEQRGDYRIAGCTSGTSGDNFLGYPILGGDESLPALFASGIKSAFVAIGDNRVRLAKLSSLKEFGFELINVVSTSAIVSPRATLGRGIAIMPGAVINVATRIEDGAIVNTGATIDHDCSIGLCAHIAPGVNLAGNVTVAEGAFLGIGSRAIPGVTVGSWSIVGAGAAVISDLDAGVTAVGVPARVTKRGPERIR